MKKQLFSLLAGHFAFLYIYIFSYHAGYIPGPVFGCTGPEMSILARQLQIGTLNDKVGIYNSVHTGRRDRKNSMWPRMRFLYFYLLFYR